MVTHVVQRPQHRGGRPAVVLTLFAALLASGFFFHTSFDPIVFGKYNLRYIVYLAVIFGILLPSFYLLTSFVFSSSELIGTGGKRVVIRPRHKLMALAILSLLAMLLGSAAIRFALAGSVATYDPQVFHPYLQNVPKPLDKSQHINRWGFRGDDIELAKPPNTFRIFVFGGSTVHCGTVPFEATHCRLLERQLQAAYPQQKIEVQNLGAEWHATEHDTIKLLFYAQDFQPDLAIIFHGINDLVRSFEPDLFGNGPYRADYAHYLGATANLVNPGRSLRTGINLFAGHWLSDFRCDLVRLEGPEGHGLHHAKVLFFPKSRPIEIEHFQSLPAFERNLRDFVAIAQTKKIPVILATQPSMYRLDLSPRDQQLLCFPYSHQFHGQRASLASMTRGMQQFNDCSRRIAAETAVRFVDLEKEMPKTTIYMYDDVHYTRAGNALIADVFADEIIRSEIIPQTLKHSPVTQPSGSFAGKTTIAR